MRQVSLSQLFPVFIPSLGQRQQQLGSQAALQKQQPKTHLFPLHHILPSSHIETSPPPTLTYLESAHHGLLRRLVSPHPPTARKARTRNREPAAATATAILQLLLLPASLALFRITTRKLDMLTDLYSQPHRQPRRRCPHGPRRYQPVLRHWNVSTRVHE